MLLFPEIPGKIPDMRGNGRKRRFWVLKLLIVSTSCQDHKWCFTPTNRSCRPCSSGSCREPAHYLCSMGKVTTCCFLCFQASSFYKWQAAPCHTQILGLPLNVELLSTLTLEWIAKPQLRLGAPKFLGWGGIQTENVIFAPRYILG